MGGMLSTLPVPSDTLDDENDQLDPLARLRKMGIIRAALSGGGDLPYQRVAKPVTPAAMGTGLSDDAAPPPTRSLMDDASAEDDGEEERPTLLRPGEDEAGHAPRDPNEPSLLREGEMPGLGLPQNEPAYSPLAEQADIAGGRARQLAAQQQALEHPSLKNRILRALVEAAPIAIGAIAAPGNAGAGVGGEASLQYQGEQEREKELQENRLQQEMEQALQQQGSLATQASLQGERQRRDQAYIDEQNALARMHENAQPREDPMEGKTVTLGDEVEQWDPQTKRFDIPVGKPKAPARGGKGWTLEYGKDGSPIALRDPQGDLHQPDDQDIPAPVQTLWSNAVANAQQSGVKPEIAAQTGPKPTSNSYNGKKYPSIKDAQAAWGADVQKLVDDETSAQGNARGAAFGRNRPISVLDTWNGNRPITVSAGEAEDNPDRYVTQGGGTPALQKEALIQDIRTTIGNVGDSLKAMKAGFTAPQRMMLAASLGDPNGTAAQFFQSIPRGSALDETQQNYVIDIFQLRENAMAMRSLLGSGQGSDDLRRAIVQTLPGPGTPSKGYAQQQLKRLNQTVDRLERGVPGVPLSGAGPQKPGAQGNGSAQPRPTHRFNPQTGRIEAIQ
jgi:hypothetical protein